jgi:hypothetical protein
MFLLGMHAEQASVAAGISPRRCTEHVGRSRRADDLASRGPTSTRNQRRSKIMKGPDNLRYTKLALSNDSGAIAALGFGTLITDPIATKNATEAVITP